MVLMRDHTLQVSKCHHQASFVSKILCICTLSVCVLVCLGKQFECKTSPLFPTLQFVSRKSEIQVLSLSSKYSQLIMNAKTNLLYFLTIGPLQLAIHVVQNRYAGELGRSALGQEKQTAHFIKVVISYVCLLSMRVLDSLPFLWTNHSVHGLGTDGKPNSVLVNFFPESRLPFAYKSVSFTEKRRRKP